MHEPEAKPKKSTDFASCLNNALEKECSSPAPLNCETTTYSTDRRLQDFCYRSREYTY